MVGLRLLHEVAPVLIESRVRAVGVLQAEVEAAHVLGSSISAASIASYDLFDGLHDWHCARWQLAAAVANTIHFGSRSCRRLEDIEPSHCVQGGGTAPLPQGNPRGQGTASCSNGLVPEPCHSRGAAGMPWPPAFCIDWQEQIAS